MILVIVTNAILCALVLVVIVGGLAWAIWAEHGERFATARNHYEQTTSQKHERARSTSPRVPAPEQAARGLALTTSAGVDGQPPTPAAFPSSFDAAQ